MRILMIAMILLSQSSACDLYYFDKSEAHFTDTNLYDAAEASNQPSLADAGGPSDGSHDQADSLIEFKSMIVPDLTKNACGQAFTFNSASIINTVNINNNRRHCTSSFFLNFTTQGNLVLLTNNVKLILQAKYLAYDYLEDGKIQLYDNIKFYAVIAGGDNYLINILPGFTSRLPPLAKQETITLEIPNVIGNRISGIKIEFESHLEIPNGMSMFSPDIMRNPASITIDSIHKINSPP